VSENEPAGAGVNESAEENARIAAWKSSVEQALSEAQAKEQARAQDAATEEHGADATIARTAAAQEAAQEAEARRIDLGVARELAKKQAETDASNEDGAAAETKASSGSGAAKEANAVDDARRQNETKSSEPSSDSSSIAGGQASTGRVNGWNRRTEIFGPTEGTDDPEAARENAIARHAMVYSWVTTDRNGHRWVHIRPLYYSGR
jgi:hypothetical protein